MFRNSSNAEYTCSESNAKNRAGGNILHNKIIKSGLSLKWDGSDFIFIIHRSIYQVIHGNQGEFTAVLSYAFTCAIIGNKVRRKMKWMTLKDRLWN